MSCKHLDCDIIIASEVSDFVDFINAFAHRDIRISLIQNHLFSIEKCLNKAKNAHFYGIGNVFASEIYDDYKRFLEKSSALKYLGNGYFKVIDSNITQNIDGNIDKIQLIKDIFTQAYASDILKYLGVLK